MSVLVIACFMVSASGMMARDADDTDPPSMGAGEAGPDPALGEIVPVGPAYTIASPPWRPRAAGRAGVQVPPWLEEMLARYFQRVDTQIAHGLPATLPAMPPHVGRPFHQQSFYPQGDMGGVQPQNASLSAQPSSQPVASHVSDSQAWGSQPSQSQDGQHGASHVSDSQACGPQQSQSQDGQHGGGSSSAPTRPSAASQGCSACRGPPASNDGAGYRVLRLLSGFLCEAWSGRVECVKLTQRLRKDRFRRTRADPACRSVSQGGVVVCFVRKHELDQCPEVSQLQQLQAMVYASASWQQLEHSALGSLGLGVRAWGAAQLSCIYQGNQAAAFHRRAACLYVRCSPGNPRPSGCCCRRTCCRRKWGHWFYTSACPLDRTTANHGYQQMGLSLRTLCPLMLLRATPKSPCC